MTRFLPFLALVVALLAACGDGDEGGAPQRTETQGAGERDVIAAGVLELPAASSFGAPGFHEVLMAQPSVPADIGPTAGRRLVLSLRDVGRPDQECSQQHPLSGCATVDWSDSPGRPNVPPDGVFDNHLALELSTGPLTLFFHEDAELATEPEQFEPG